MMRSKGKARPQTSKKLTNKLIQDLVKTKISNSNNNKRKTSKNTGYFPGFSAAVGEAVGNFVGGKSLAPFGKRAGDWFGRISGLGDYKIQNNSLIHQNNNSPPLFQKSNGSVSVTHREFLADISGSTAFQIASYPINVGMQTTFPFLSQIAANFEQYRLKGLIFEFKSTSATAVSSTNTALGTVIMATNYDSLDATFQNKQQMDAYEFSSSTVPCNNVVHPIECKPRQNTLSEQYVRTGGIPAGSDLRFYDMGKFQIATVGMQAASVIGELWVSYHVDLIRPKLQTPIGANNLADHFILLPTTGSISNGAARSNSSTLGSTVNLGVISIPTPGRYLVELIIKAVTSTNYTADFTFGTSVTNAASNVLYPFTMATTLNNQSVGNGTINTSITVVVDVNSVNGTFNMPTATIVGAASGDLFITQIPGQFQ